MNASGTAFGGDRTFQTTKVPLSLSILASPNPVLFGAPVIVIQGTLSGTGNAGRQVILRGPAVPLHGAVRGDRQPRADARRPGSFSFTLLGAASSMQFQVVTTTKPVVASLVATENVAVRVSQPPRPHAPPRASRASTAPSRPPRTARRWGSCASPTATACSPAARSCATTARRSSSFSRVVRVHRGVYRVLVRVVGAAQISNYGQPLLIR